MNKYFTDGFVFIELGPQATDPSIKLRDIYNLLTGEQCGINVIEQKINQLTSDYYHNLPVIIDDVWYVEDAEPLVKAFLNCKTILTTRMNDIEQYIPSKQSVIIGPMTQHEAITLLTRGVIDSSQLSQEDVCLLDELAQDVHLWPLLLSLIRGQLSHNLKQYHLSNHAAIQNVQAKLHHKGLTAFDKNNIEAINKCRKLAVKACIEITLELLTKPLSDKIQTLILYTGIGTSLQIAVLNNLWNISKQKAEEIIDVLWAYGLIQFTDVKISPDNITQHCVEVHAVISQYIIEFMDSYEVLTHVPYNDKLNTAQSVGENLVLTFRQSYGVHDLPSLKVVDYMKYKLSEIENHNITYLLKRINMYTVIDPHDVIVTLRWLKDALISSPCAINLLLLEEEINTLKNNCNQLIKDSYKFCRKFNQRTQRSLCDKNYDELIQTVEKFVKIYPVCNVAKKAVTMVKKIIPYCDGELQDYVIFQCERLQAMTSDYHYIIVMVLPHIKIYIQHHKKITDSLLNESPDIEQIYHYFSSGKCNEELEMVNINWFNKLKEVAPRWIQQQASLQPSQNILHSIMNS